MRKILIKGSPLQKEAVAEAAVTPGDLVELTSSGTVQRHSTAGGAAARTFAREREMVGDGVDTDYAADDTVIYLACPHGTEVKARLSASQTIDVGDALESAGAGKLRALASGVIVARAAEAVTSGGGETPLITVEVD